MSSLDAFFTLQPSELFPTTTLDRIATLSSADALALLPKITTLLAHEAAAWADYCASVQTNSMRYNTLITQPHARGTHVEAIKAIALRHLLTTLPARFGVLAGLNRCEVLEPLSETLAALRDAVAKEGITSGGAGFSGYHRRVVYDRGFAEAIEEQEAVLTGLENARMEQLRRMRMVLVGGERAAFTSTRHVVVFVGVMEEIGIDVEGILQGGRRWRCMMQAKACAGFEK